MKKLIVLGVFFVQAIAFAQDKPKLVVGIVIDQMRQDYLYRFSEKFGEDGFQRFKNQGYTFKNAHYNYVPTYTAPGHASIYTGTTPSNHSIIANYWYDKKIGRSRYCVADESEVSVGGSEQAGKMSPRNLQASTITDELLLTTNFRSKVVGVSIKDRGSILPAGHNPTGAYWFDSKTGNFITSSYYLEKLPIWVETFNNQKLVNHYLTQSWEPLLPIEEYVESTPDEVPYENAFKGQSSAVFPYILPELVKNNGIGIIRTTPYGNTLVMDMAIAAIEGESLGDDQITDFLAVSFSSTDYVGHAFGPNSIELEDTYLRLDLELQRLFEYLDQSFGDDYLVFLTADHGVVEVPQFLLDNKMAGGYRNNENTEKKVEEALIEKFGKGEWIENLSNNQVFLNHSLIEERGIDLKVFRNFLKKTILKLDDVSRVYTADEIAANTAADPFKGRLANGFNMQMSGDLLIALKPGFLNESGYDRKGTTHGSGYTYDTHVPILFYGQGIRAGSSVRPVSITDIAPTLSMLLEVSLPSFCTGKPLIDLFENE